MISGSPVPKSLIRRGVAVPFTSRLLVHARVRQGRDGLVFLLHDLGDGHGYYVVPAAHLQKLPGMTVYDNALFAALTEGNIWQPLGVAKQAAKIAITGLGGAQPMYRYRSYLQDLTQESGIMTLRLIQRAVAQLSDADDAARQLDLAGLAKPQGIQAASKALGGFAKKAKITSEDLFKRLDDWTKSLVPLGLGDEPYKYSVQATLNDITKISGDLKRWLITEPVGPAELAQRTALAMQHTASLGNDLIATQTDMIDNMGDTLANWDGRQKQIADISDTLQYLISGWRTIAFHWHDRENRERFSQREFLQETAPFLPRLPEDMTGKHSDFWTDLQRLQPKWATKTQLVQRMDHAIIGGLERFRREAI